jgi:hypothetical protein
MQEVGHARTQRKVRGIGFIDRLDQVGIAVRESLDDRVGQSAAALRRRTRAFP